VCILFIYDAPFEKKNKPAGGILLFLSKNMSADTLTLGFSLKVEPYNAPAGVQLFTSLPVCVDSLINFGYAYRLNKALIIYIYIYIYIHTLSTKL
jgi:hypothetical protein